MANREEEPSGGDRHELSEYLVLLYELEGLVTGIMDAYYLAAVEWNGIGSRIKALSYARLGLANSLPYYGPHEPVVESLQRMIHDTTKHWSWKYRLRNEEALSHV